MTRRGIFRRMRKFAAIIIGVALGWYVAEVAFNQVPQPSAAQAAEVGPLALSEEPGKDHGADPAKADSPEGKNEGETHKDHAHETPDSVKKLVPGGGQTPWYGRVVWYAVLLFVLAAVLGPVVIALKGPDLPDPADKHDDHGHDKGGHGGGHGH